MLPIGLGRGRAFFRQNPAKLALRIVSEWRVNRLAGQNQRLGNTARWSGGGLIEIPKERLNVTQNVSLFVLEHVVVCPGKLYNPRERVRILEV